MRHLIPLEDQGRSGDGPGTDVPFAEGHRDHPTTGLSPTPPTVPTYSMISAAKRVESLRGMTTAPRFTKALPLPAHPSPHPPIPPSHPVPQRFTKLQAKMIQMGPKPSLEHYFKVSENIFKLLRVLDLGGTEGRN